MKAPIWTSFSTLRIVFVLAWIFSVVFLLNLYFNDVFISYLIFISITLPIRLYIRRYHSKGINAVKNQKYLEAIEQFKLSYDYIQQNNWIDTYDLIVLMNVSKYKYSEMALMNIAFSYSQIGDKMKAIEWYEKVAKDFPENGTALAALKMLSL